MSSGDDDSVAIVDGLELYMTSSTATVGAAVLGSKKAGVPTHPAQVNRLLKFVRVNGAMALSGPRLDAFEKLQGQLRATHSTTRATLLKNWTKKYCGEKLALIVAMHDAETKANPPKQSAAPSGDESDDEEEMAGLLRHLKALFRPLYTRCIEEKRKEDNKRMKTPTLSHHKTGARPQDVVQFYKNRAYKNACPVC